MFILFHDVCVSCVDRNDFDFRKIIIVISRFRDFAFDNYKFVLFIVRNQNITFHIFLKMNCQRFRNDIRNS